MHACATVRVYGDRLGCVVTSGAHTITFTFAPTSARDGLRLTAAGLLIAVPAVVALSVRRRPPGC